MANISASTWKRGYWESASNSLGYLDDVYASLGNALNGEFDTITNNYVSGWLYGGGSFAMYGQNFQTAQYERDVLISRIIVNGVDLNLDMHTDLHGGGVLGVAGRVSSIAFNLYGNQFTASGDMRISESGSTYAFNTTEEIALANGLYLRSETNAAGNYVKHYASLGGNSITLLGNWTYGQTENWRDLFSQADTFNGTSGNDFLEGYEGNDTLLGGAGIDTAVYAGLMTDYTITQTDASHYAVLDRVLYRDGQDSLELVERLEFLDKTVAFDVGSTGLAGKAYRIYKAAFDRTPDSVGLGYWIAQMDAGMDLIEVSARFIDSNEFRTLYGTHPTNGEFLTGLYANVLDRTPDAGGYAWWMDQLANNQEKTWQKVLADFSESPENQANVVGQTGNGIVYDFWA